MTLADRLVVAWYRQRLTPLTAALVPLSWLFAGAAAFRRRCYRSGRLRMRRLDVPVIVVGNITVGGSGKTPLVAALARALKRRGWRPGIVSRGYGRDFDDGVPIHVRHSDDPAWVGDEPLLLAREGFPVVVARDRAAAGRALISAHHNCNVIIADDGLQHYALARDVEIAVVDATRGLGNGRPLPAGPMREPRARLAEVDAVVINGAVSDLTVALPQGAVSMTLTGDRFHRVNAPDVSAEAPAFAGDGVHAIAGTGNPGRFFAQLRGLGIEPIEHPLRDHHRFIASDIAFPGARAILMTEKDAVKCASFADDRCWYLPVQAQVDHRLIDLVEDLLRKPYGHEAP